MSKTVLVVDDDPKFLSTLSSLLKDAGYIVITAKEAKAVNLALESYQVNAAIIDLDLPEIGGLQIIGQLARHGKPPIAIMAITGAYSDVYLEVAEYLGAHVSVRKPRPGRPLTPIVAALNILVSKPPSTKF